MASKNKNRKNKGEALNVTTEQIKDVSPWAERIGVYIVGLMTTLGLVLIMYTGVRAATYNTAEEVPELLTHDDIVSTTDNDDVNTTDDEDTVDVDNEEDTDSKDEDEADANATDEEEDADEEEDVVDESTSFNAVVNSDAVNVREKPQANDQTEILGVLNSGDKIKVLDSEYSNIWMQIEYDGEIAYVSKNLIDLID